MAEAFFAEEKPHPMQSRSIVSLLVALSASLFVPALQLRAETPNPAPVVPSAKVPNEDKYPKPDLGEVEKHYKITTYRYDDATEKLTMTLIPLVEGTPTTYKVLFYDAAGERIDSGYTLFYYSTVKGEPKTCTIGIPKRVMDKAKKATLTR